jgi:AcrR family transcriptional regulator
MVDSAIALGTRSGAGALTLQGVATASGVSKALVLYHHGDKDALLLAVAQRLVSNDVDALRAAAAETDALEGWSAVVGDAKRRAERALLVTLLQEPSVRAAAPELLAARAQAGVALAHAVFTAAGLRSRIANSLLGRFVVHLVDGIAVGTQGKNAGAIEADLDATALALLGLGTE